MLLPWVLACSTGNEKPAQAEPTGAVLEGRIRLKPGEQLPSYAGADLGWRMLLGEAPAAVDGCTPPRQLQPVRAKDGMLSGVVVAASGFTGGAHRPERTHQVRIADCRLQPAIVTATREDSLVLRNDGQGAYAPSFGPALYPGPMSPGADLNWTLQPGVDSIMCTEGAPCGRTDVVVFHHSLHTVTDAAGHFRIENFPIRQQVVVNAWHPLFEEARTGVWLTRGEHKEIEIQLEPRRRD